MSKRLILFSLWCLALVGVAALSSWYAYDPFADADAQHTGPGDHTRTHGRRGGGGFWFFGGGGGRSGPAHK